MKSESEVAQSCLTLCDPIDSSLPGSSVHGIFQARVLEWVAIAFSAHPPYMFSKENLPVLLPEKTTTKNHAHGFALVTGQGHATPYPSGSGRSACQRGRNSGTTPERRDVWPTSFKGYLYLFIWLHRVSLASLRISWLRHVRSRTLT